MGNPIPESMGKPMCPSYGQSGRSAKMTVGERISERLQVQGLSQAELARRVNVDQSTINGLIRGSARTSRHLHRIARELSTTAAYLSGETDDPAGDAVVPPNPAELASQMGLVKVSEIDLDIGMGAGFMDESQIEELERWVPQEWISALTTTPAPLLTFARPFGDSMYPTINDRDIVLIDRSERTIQQQDAIWALVYGGLSTIKRVRMRPDGTARLMADNPQVRDETATDGELFVIGRVAGVIRRT